MKILITGNGKSGSWQVRGEQLGRAIGARIVPKCYHYDDCDLAIFVKRTPPDMVRAAQNAKKRIIWDCVDAYPQPVGNEWPQAQLMAWFRNQIKMIRPYALVAATQKMADDLSVAFDGPIIYLPHHARPNIQRNIIREKVQSIGYEGGEQYLGRWRHLLEKECKRRNWTFVLNPEHLSDLDIVAVFRDHGGYAPKSWKSNVKLANAHGSGTPIVLNRERGYEETACGHERWVDTGAELATALDELEPYEFRRKISQEFLKKTITLESVAKDYRNWIEGIM